MPDQSSASTEHALIREVTEPLSRLPHDALAPVADVDFPVALRGYDRLAVDAYVKRTSQLVAELQATRSPEAAVRRALERVGEEVSGILKRAHETAEQITAASRSEAEGRLEVARQEAAEIMSSAERRLKELDAETDRIWAERRQIVEDVQHLAGRLMSISETALERFPPAEEEMAAAEAGVPEEELPAEELDAEEERVALLEESDGSDGSATRLAEFEPDATSPTEHVAELVDPPDADDDATAVMPPLEGELP